jgi:hypothetical protein
MFNKCFHENRAVSEITCKNMIQPGRPQIIIIIIIIIRRRRTACWITKATNTQNT